MLTEKEKDIIRLVIFREHSSPTRMKEISQLSDEDARAVIQKQTSVLLNSLQTQKEFIERQIANFTE
jgi:hypothetical protein